MGTPWDPRSEEEEPQWQQVNVVIASALFENYGASVSAVGDEETALREPRSATTPTQVKLHVGKFRFKHTMPDPKLHRRYGGLPESRYEDMCDDFPSYSKSMWPFQEKLFKKQYDSMKKPAVGGNPDEWEKIDFVAYSHRCALAARERLYAKIVEKMVADGAERFDIEAVREDESFDLPNLRWFEHMDASRQPTSWVITADDWDVVYRRNLKQFLKNMFKMHDGEVIELRGQWEPAVGGDDDDLWFHQQMAVTERQRAHLPRPPLTTLSKNDLAALGAMTHMQVCEGQLCFRHGYAITLPELMCDWFGEYTYRELYFWYLQSPRLVNKRVHPVENARVRSGAPGRRARWARRKQLRRVWCAMTRSWHWAAGADEGVEPLPLACH